jgi:hypothetical protein
MTLAVHAEDLGLADVARSMPSSRRIVVVFPAP